MRGERKSCEYFLFEPRGAGLNRVDWFLGLLLVCEIHARARVRVVTLPDSVCAHIMLTEKKRKRHI